MIRFKKLALALVFACLGSAACASAEPAACSSGCLLDLVNRYLDAMTAHDPSTLPLAAGLRATENGKDVQLGEGLWKSAQGIVYRQTVVDPSAGQAIFFGVVKEADGQALLALRLAIRDGKIAESESMVARKGAHALFNPEALRSTKPVWTAPVPAEDRLPRTRLIAIANSYFDGIEQHSAEAVPFHPDCIRTENGVQTTNSDTPGSLQLSCSAGFKNLAYIRKVRGRRFPIVDPVHGLVLAIVHFDIPGTPGQQPPATPSNDPTPALAASTRTLFLYELFKVEDGRIREIQAFMRNEPLGASNGWEK